MNQENFALHHGDCLEVLRGLPDASVDSIVTDPPYGLSFMGKRWDYDVPSVEVWAECWRVLKPGGHLLAFAGTRTQHRMAVRIEDAGFEIRDMIAWVYGSGFPKSLDVSKAIDGQVMFGGSNTRQLKMVNESRPGDGRVRSSTNNNGIVGTGGESTKVTRDEPATEAGRQWSGWGTALKPALEPITVARKPLIGTVAENVLTHGTGALNIDGCRVAYENDCRLLKGGSYGGNRVSQGGASIFGNGGKQAAYVSDLPSGRWPANLIHDGSEEVLAGFPDGAKAKPARSGVRGGRGFGHFDHEKSASASGYWPADEGGSAARFFYCAKASKADRGGGNVHPTVKPTDLMRYLCRLVTPPGGIVLDPFMGSGSTGRGAMLEGFRFVGIEREAEYVEIARARIAAANPPANDGPDQPDLFGAT